MSIRDKIHTIRDIQVILDQDIAKLYDVEVKRLNEQVKRNSERFPDNFMFQLTESEFTNLRSQFATTKHGGRRYLPYAFTEQGVAMLSGVLKSDIAIQVSIQIINAFVKMRRFIASNAEMFYRLNILEKQLKEHGRKLEQVFHAIECKRIQPEKGIFFDRQVFDAHLFVSDIVRSAQKSIILIDNYVDESVLILFCKRRKGGVVRIFTKNITKQLKLDIKKYNKQYDPVEIVKFERFHDRFLIIDDKEVYHIGASLKDLGKRWFAFSRFDKENFRLLDRLES